jgi:putative selenium metabolism protein SsnA
MVLLIKNAKVLQLYPPAVTEETDVLVRDGVITALGKNLEKGPGGGLPGGGERGFEKAGKVIDAGGGYVMPGNVCAHNHFYSALARGITSRVRPSPDFVSVLQNLWWRLDRALDESSLYYSGLVGAIEAVRAGTTAVIDHNASPSFIGGSLKVLKSAFEKCGLRGILCYEVTDRNGPRDRDAGVEENAEFIAGNETGLVKGAVGAHAPFTLDDGSLAMLSRAVRKTGRGIHIHVSEDRFDLSFSNHLYGLSPLERLDGHDLLDEMSLVIHGVHLTAREVGLLEGRGSFLVHNPRSNMNNAVGYCGFLPGLANAAIGTDGIGSDMFEETRIGYFKSRDAGSGLSPSDFARFLCGGNLILERYFGGRFGRVEPGCAADLVILDYKNPTPLDERNVAGHLVFGLGSAAVKTVIVGGRCVYEDRRFPFDADAVYVEARKEAARLWTAVDRL